MHRRSFLAATASVPLAAGLAGCSALFDASRPDALEDVDADPDQLPTPTRGDGDVTVAVYEDLGCPACHDFQADVMPELEAELIEPDEIAYRHYDFVVGAADESVAMANAARAVQDETRDGDDPNGAFFAYKAAVMNADDWSDDGLAELAELVDADPDAVTAALEDETYYPTLAADWERGEDAGVEATPTVVVDGEQIEDPFDTDEIFDAVEDAS
ncbi:thioredoxin domain-containing protein [Natronolimnohabitans sp. A-GB9]|uniref:DsbA family protein n=1 Tax=Natronolimnohabitans sp. A-GB9 TaxID=3069757 RepID=UPI0027AF7BC8|nr:thioredoxin domain-containing protein [Natronolimnohabitans sp. A-GB9]MDQ2051460.1 thioredoxin domain-containing protein [Natronolimnohabitans sp. A-GB9]